jgi:hypothetical protein
MGARKPLAPVGDRRLGTIALGHFAGVGLDRHVAGSDPPGIMSGVDCCVV